MVSYRFVALAVFLLTLQGCDVTVSTNGQRYEGGGVVFVVPLQTSEVSNGAFGIDYKSTRLNAHTNGKSLFVDGRGYGSLDAGDVVDFTEFGVVKVNGVPRNPIPADI